MKASTKQIATAPQIDMENPGQILGMVQNPKMKAFITAICASKGTVEAEGLSQWEARAAQEVWRCWGIEPQTKSQDFCLGLLLGFWAGMKVSPENMEHEFKEPGLAAFLAENDLKQLSISVYANEACESPQAAEDFFSGFNAGKKTTPEAMRYFSPPHTTVVYLIIFFARRDIAALKTVSAIHNWLVSKKVIPKKADPRNTRTLLRRIGFPFVDAGRPRKIKTATVR